jgi:hypothetical protein
LQDVMALLKAADLGVPLQFQNFRDWLTNVTTSRRFGQENILEFAT